MEQGWDKETEHTEDETGNDGYDENSSTTIENNTGISEYIYMKTK